jgi:DNA replication and repair protein RecF
MKLEALVLNNFRNLADGELSFSTRLTFFVGRNGQGKTNLLEAIYLLAFAKSFRSSKPPELKRWGKEHVYTSVSGRISSEVGDKTVSYIVEDNSRKILINGNFVRRASDFFGKFRAIEFTPEDLFICKGSPSERRTFIDRMLAAFDNSFVEIAQDYEKALKHRNTILRDLKAQNPRSVDRKRALEELAPWNVVLAETGLKISEKRLKLVADLLPSFAKNYRSLSGAEQAHLEYQPNLSDGKGSLPNQDDVAFRYGAEFDLDLRRGKTNLGPHLDELEIALTFGDQTKSARNSASQGQSRSVVLALKLAALELIHDKTADWPVLLLDDVESELDPARRAALHRLIAGYPGQVFVSTTELQLAKDFVGDNSERFQALIVSDGRVIESGPK